MPSGSSRGVRGATAQPVTEPAANGMIKSRLLSAAIAIPPTLGAIYLGPPYFDLFVLVAAFILLWEWVRLCGRGVVEWPTIVLAAVVPGAVGCAMLLGIGSAMLVLAAGLAAALLFIALAPDAPRRSRRRWLAIGVLYLGLPCVLLVELRGDDAAGRVLLLWLFAVVWAADTGAFVFGRWVGGPRLAPKVSPAKTWAGFVGGTVCAAAVGAAFTGTIGQVGASLLAAAGGLLGVASALGDLLESWIKRRFGVKDAGGIMPGHGGLLDRVDGLLAATVALAVMGGLGEVGLFAWY